MAAPGIATQTLATFTDNCDAENGTNVSIAPASKLDMLLKGNKDKLLAATQTPALQPPEMSRIGTCLSDFKQLNIADVCPVKCVTLEFPLPPVVSILIIVLHFEFTIARTIGRRGEWGDLN